MQSSHGKTVKMVMKMVKMVKQMVMVVLLMGELHLDTVQTWRVSGRGQGGRRVGGSKAGMGRRARGGP